jgi:dTDP-glucose 4,6-dehydratase
VTLIGGGNDARDFIHVDDISLAIELAVKHKADGVFNLSGGRSVTMHELLDVIQSLTGARIEVRHQERIGEPLKYALSLERIQRQLGFEPRVSLERGLESEIRWIEGNLVL